MLETPPRNHFPIQVDKTEQNILKCYSTINHKLFVLYRLHRDNFVTENVAKNLSDSFITISPPRKSRVSTKQFTLENKTRQSGNEECC